MRQFWKKYKNKILVSVIGSVLILSLLSLFAVAAGAVMKLFGFYYESAGAVILFFIVGALVSYIPGTALQALPKMLLRNEMVSRRASIIIYIVIDTFISALGFAFADYLMPSVSASATAVLVVSLLFSLPGISDFRKISD